MRPALRPTLFNYRNNSAAQKLRRQRAEERKRAEQDADLARFAVSDGLLDELLPDEFEF